MMPSSSVHILLADDDQEDIELMEEAFVNANADVVLHKVGNGHAALQFLSSQPDERLPSLIILDYNMPEMTGLEVLMEICRDERYDKIPKVILSTSSTSAHIRESKESGAVDYFIKPSSLAELKVLVQKLLSIIYHPS